MKKELLVREDALLVGPYIGPSLVVDPIVTHGAHFLIGTDDVLNLKLDKLKRKLKRRRLVTKGNKKMLQDRLKRAME